MDGFTEAQVAWCIEWLRRMPDRLKRPNGRAYAYRLKHHVERWSCTRPGGDRLGWVYISEAALIEAARRRNEIRSANGHHLAIPSRYLQRGVSPDWNEWRPAPPTQEVVDFLDAGGVVPAALQCPRCGRRGAVSDDPESARYYVVKWEPRSGRGVDRDTCVTLADLCDPTFGCGHDGLGYEGAGCE